MKCLVCGREFEGDICDICGFQVIEFPGDPEEGIRALMPTINAYKEEFVQTVSVGMLLYRWTVNDGKIESGNEEYLPFGNLADLVGKTVWLNEAFDVVSNRELVETTVYIQLQDENGKTKLILINAQAPNLQGGDKQKLGITVSEDFVCHLNVQCGNNQAVSADSFHLFTQKHSETVDAPAYQHENIADKLQLAKAHMTGNGVPTDLATAIAYFKEIADGPECEYTIEACQGIVACYYMDNELDFNKKIALTMPYSVKMNALVAQQKAALNAEGQRLTKVLESTL